MSFDEDVIPDDMDEGIAPAIMFDEDFDRSESPFHFTAFDVEQTVSQLTTACADESELISQIQTLLSVFSFSSLNELMDSFIIFLAPPAMGSIEQKRHYMQTLKSLPKSKCRCDAQWYAKEGVDNIAFGCKTCAMSSASCICVSCFEAGDHEGHDFYIIRSDYGCCDCGDIYAWKKEGFCQNHSGPIVGDDPSLRLEEWTRLETPLIVRALMEHVISFMADEQEIASNAEVIESSFQFSLDLASQHDGLRRLIGTTLIDFELASRVLANSHLFPPQPRQLWTKLLVDLMLDLEFKSRFASVFVQQYSAMVISRLGDRKMKDISDLACQMFTRADVAFRLASEENVIPVLLETLGEVLDQAMIDLNPESVDIGPCHEITSAMAFRNLNQNVIDLEFVQHADASIGGTDAPPILTFNDDEEGTGDSESSFHSVEGGGEDTPTVKILDHGAQVIKSHEAFMCSMGLIFILDHPEVVSDPNFLEKYWKNFLNIVERLQFMNPHRRRVDVHVEFPDSSWSLALNSQGVLISSFWLVLEYVKSDVEKLDFMLDNVMGKLSDWLKRFDRLEGKDELSSLFCPLNRIAGLLMVELLRKSSNIDGKVLKSVENVQALMILPLKARAFHSETSLGLWTRNGESVNMESRFYNSIYFHHHTSSADMAVLRISLLRLTQLGRLDVFFSTAVNDVFKINQESTGLNGFLRLLVELLSRQSELALDEKGLVQQRITAFLALKDCTFSRLKDPKLEAWTHTLTPKRTSMLETVLGEIGELVQGTPNYRLCDTQWLSLDLVSPFYTWRDMQTAEERLLEYLKKKMMTLKDWIACNGTIQPVITNIETRTMFDKFLSSEWLVAVVWFGLYHCVQRKEDFRSLKLVCHMVVRLCYPGTILWRERRMVGPTSTPNIELPSPVTVGSVFNVFKNVEWTLPWDLQIIGDSIRSLLMELELREVNAEMKEWLAVALSLISKDQTVKVEETAGSTSPQETKRKRAQQQLMNRLSKRLDTFLKNQSVGTPDEVTGEESGECVMCLSGSDRPMGHMAYIAQSAWNPLIPRQFIPTHEALIPNSMGDTNFLPFEAECVPNFLTRNCGHSLHPECWTELCDSQEIAKDVRGFILCPYCNRPCNVLMLEDRVEGELPSDIEQLVSDQINQLTVSLRKPSSETDLVSLQRGLTSLIGVFKSRRERRVTGSLIELCLDDAAFIEDAFRDEWTTELSKIRVLVKQVVKSEPPLAVIELCMKPWVAKAHVMWHYLVSSSHQLPFDEIIAVESMLTVRDEFSLLVDLLPFHVSLDFSVEADVPGHASLPVLIFKENRIEHRYFESFIKREKARVVAANDVKFVEYYPGLIPIIPSIYQKLYTAYLKAACVSCRSSPRQAVVCLACGRLLCLQNECCKREIASHYSTQCSLNGIGIFLQLTNGEVHLISSEKDRIMAASWGSLFLDSHGEWYPNLSKPLQLNQARIERLVNELRENSWVWKQGSKNLSWRRPFGLL